MKSNTHYRTCNLCEAMCGLEIQLEHDQIVSIRGDENDPFSQGHICPKAVALQDIYEDPDRLKHPVRRTGSGWEQIGWEEAYEEIADNLRKIQQEHGNNAVGVYLGNPNVHSSGAVLYAPPLLRTLRTQNRFSATSADQLPHHFAGYFMFGHYLLLPIPDVDRTQFMLMLGANPLASNGSLMTAPGIEKRLKKIQQRGGRVVVIDPRKTETARKADAHHFIRPGTDALFLAAIIHTLFKEGLVDFGRFEEFVTGAEALAREFEDFSPEKVAPVTGIDAQTTIDLAREFAEADSGVCYGRMGASTQQFGAATHWLINAINLLTANLDEPGGAMFTSPAIDLVGLASQTGRRGSFGRWESRVRGLPEFAGELPAAALAEEILTPGDDQIKAMMTIAGNPVLSTPNGGQLDQALAELDFMVSIDIYINETTRHANIILPPKTGLEVDHYDIVFHALAVRNTAKYSPALFESKNGRKHDWEILQELRKALAKSGEATKKKSRFKLDPFARFSHQKLLDLSLKMGPYGSWGGRKFKRDSLNLRKLKKAVHGVDLGPLRPIFPKRIMTESGKIELAPKVFIDDLTRLRETFFGENNGALNGFDLLLIGRRHLRSNNSWMHNSERLVRGKNRCTLMIHPQDAEKRDIAENALVEVSSRVGAVQLPAEFNDDMMPGVVSVPHGWGHNREGVQLKTAQAHAGASANDLTDDRFIDELSGNAAFNGVPVAVKSIES